MIPLAYLLDTDWTVDFLAKRRPAVDLVQQLLLDGIAISVITYMEIAEGVRGSCDPQSAQQGLSQFLLGVPVLDVTLAVAERAAEIRLALRRQKWQVHERALDIIVAATAIEHGLIMVTRNLAHYQDVAGLILHQQT